jgi:hypothetical protein
MPSRAGFPEVNVMSLLKNPNEFTDPIRLCGLLYGAPGTGKTTLALSSPTPVMIDADNGMRRVEKRFQVPSLPLRDFSSLIELLNGNELDPFETIVIDTLGRLVERIGDYVAADNAKYRKKDGSLSLQGFGQVKTEFQRMLRLIQDHGKHFVIVAHDREERDGDARIVRPDGGQGSSGREVIKDMDFIGYVQMIGDERTISFSPCEQFYAKNALQLPSIIKIPDTRHGNTFIKDYLLQKAIERKEADDDENRRYVELLTVFDALVNAVYDAESANDVYEKMREAEVIWDSRRVAWHRLSAKAEAMGLVFDRAAKAFVDPRAAERAPETERNAAIDKEVVAAVAG